MCDEKLKKKERERERDRHFNTPTLIFLLWPFLQALYKLSMAADQTFRYPITLSESICMMSSKNKSLEMVHGHLQTRNAFGADSELLKEEAAGS